MEEEETGGVEALRAEEELIADDSDWIAGMEWKPGGGGRSGFGGDVDLGESFAEVDDVEDDTEEKETVCARGAADWEEEDEEAEKDDEEAVTMKREAEAEVGE